MKQNGTKSLKPESLMYKLLYVQQEIDKVASRLLKIDGVFGSTSLRNPKFNPPELGFLRLVSWLYVMYEEVGKPNVQFLVELFSAYKLGMEHLFNWNEIPGSENENLLKTIHREFEIDLREGATVEKIYPNKILLISNRKNRHSLTINNDTTQVNLRIEDGRTYKFSVIAENKDLKVYDNRLVRHPLLVRQLRTFLNHNLDAIEDHDISVQDSCELWFKRQCGTPVPEKDHQWRICLIGLLKEAIIFFEGLRNCVRNIEKDESRDQITSDWSFRLKRYHPPNEFDYLISKTAMDMGREKLDIVRFRRRHFVEWTNELSLLQGDYNFQIEGRKLIERELLNKTRPWLPITGEDIINELSIIPGPDVGQILDIARDLYTAEPCSKEELLQKLKGLK